MTFNSYVLNQTKPNHCPWFYNEKWKILKLSTVIRYTRDFILLDSLVKTMRAKITCWNVKIRAERPCHWWRKGMFSQIQYFLSDHQSRDLPSKMRGKRKKGRTDWKKEGRTGGKKEGRKMEGRRNKIVYMLIYMLIHTH